MTSLANPAGAAAGESSRGSASRPALIALIAFLTVVDLFATQAILPTLTRIYGVSPAAMSLAVNATTLGMAIASVATAFIAHRLDRRLGVAASLALLSVPTLLLAFAPNLGVFAALRIAQGLCMASAFTLTLAYLGERYMATNAAGAFAAYITGNVASNLFGRLISAGIADHFGVAANFIVFAGLNLAGAALAYATMLRIEMPENARTGQSSFAQVSSHLSDARLQAAFAIGFCILFAFIGTFSFVNFVLVAPPLGLSMMSLGFVYLVFLPSIPTTLAAGPLVGRIGGRQALRLGLAIAVLGLPLLLLPSVGSVIAGLGLVAIGTFFAQAVATGLVGRIAGAGRGSASGLYLASYFTGGLVGTAVLGVVFDRIGWPGCVAGIGLALLAAAALAGRLRD